MVRTQIQLTEKQARQLRAKARERGVSVAELIRQCVDEALRSDKLSRKELYAKAAGIVGKLEDPRGASDLARRHDDYLDEAFE